MLVGTVLDTFEIKGRGLVVAVKCQGDRLARGIELHVGDEVEIVHSGTANLRATVAGLELSSPPAPPDLLCFSLRAVSRADVPINAQVWIV